MSAPVSFFLRTTLKKGEPFCRYTLEFPGARLIARFTRRVRCHGKTRWTVRRYQQGFARSDGGSQRLVALIFSKAPSSWRLPK